MFCTYHGWCAWRNKNTLYWKCIQKKKTSLRQERSNIRSYISLCIFYQSVCHIYLSAFYPENITRVIRWFSTVSILTISLNMYINLASHQLPMLQRIFDITWMWRPNMLSLIFGHYCDVVMSAIARRVNFKAPRHWPLWGESRRILLTK